MDESRAQAIVLASLLEGVALPGTGQPITFPDLASYPDARRVVIAEPDRWQGQDLPPGVGFVSPAEAGVEMPSAGPAIIYEFLSPEPRPDRIGVRLRISLLGSSGRPDPLGEIIVDFDLGDPPRAIDQPRVLAY